MPCFGSTGGLARALRRAQRKPHDRRRPGPLVEASVTFDTLAKRTAQRIENSAHADLRIQTIVTIVQTFVVRPPAS
jgi:hypothetical protein